MKRAFDFIISILGLFFLSPILLLIAILVRVKIGKPVLFRQLRPGKNGEPFTIVKFRTMTDGRDNVGVLLPDAKRLNRFGRLLRSTSLDELPELWNVLKGDMSLVGPRPLLLEYLPLYSEIQTRRNEVRPGITGLAQVKGRNSLSWEEKFKFDVWYVDHHRLALDFAILFWTFKAVVSRDGVDASNLETMPPFRGKEQES